VQTIHGEEIITETFWAVPVFEIEGFILLWSAGMVPNSEKASRRFIVRNVTRGTVIAEYVDLADTPRARRLGLLKRKGLPPGNGLWIYPCQAIHTFWMRFSIDVAFLDLDRRVKRVYHRMPPFRLTRIVWGARSVLELASGVLTQSGTEEGDELQFLLRND